MFLRFLSGFTQYDYDVCQYSFLHFSSAGILEFLRFVDNKFGNISAIISSFPPTSSYSIPSPITSLFFWDSNYRYSRLLKTVWQLTDACEGFCLFLAFYPFWIVLIAMSSSSLTFSSETSNLLLNPVQYIFLVSDIDYIFISRSLMLVFFSPVSLLAFFYLFEHM